MTFVEDAKPAIAGAVIAIGATFAVNPTLSVGVGTVAAIIAKRRAKPKSNFLLVGGLMFVLVGIGGAVLGTFPGGVVALAGAVGGFLGLAFRWLGRKLDQWALGRIGRIVWTLIHLPSTLVVIFKIAIILPVTFAAGVVGADVPILGDFAFVLYCFAVLAGFYALDQGKSIFQVRRKLFGQRRSRVKDAKTAAEKAEAAAAKAEDAGATVRDAEADDVKAAASSAKEAVSSARDRSASDASDASAPEAGASEVGTTEADGTEADAPEASASTSEVPTEDEIRDDEPAPGVATAETDAGSTDSVSTDWLAETPTETTLVLRNEAADPKSVRVGCRVDGETRFSDDVRLRPDEATDWTDLPDSSRFEIGVIVENGPSVGRRFDPEDSPHGRIAVRITDSDIAFTGQDTPQSSHGDAVGSGEASAASQAAAGTSSGTTAGPESSSGTTTGAKSSTGRTASSKAGQAGRTPSKETGRAASSEAGGRTESQRSHSSDIVAEALDTGSARDSQTTEATSGAGGTTNPDVNESGKSASELATAVRQSPSDEHIEQLRPFLDAPTPSERQDAVTALRQSVGDHPEPVVGAVPSLAALLDDELAQTREEAIITLQRLSKTHPDAVADATSACIGALDDESPQIRTAACRILGEIGASEAAETLERLSADDSHKGVQVAAYQALQSIENR